MNVYKLKITKVFRQLKINEHNDVAMFVEYKILANNDSKVCIEHCGKVSLDPPQGEKYTPYFELTEDQVEGWVMEILKKNGEYEAIIKELGKILDEATISADLPWEN
jgi:hypothetical protein